MVIRQLVEHMNEELDDAKKYAQCAMECRSSRKALSDLYLSLGKEELSHFLRLVDQASQIIEAARQADKAPSAAMMELYNYEHGKVMESYSQIKVLLDSIK